MTQEDKKRVGEEERGEAGEVEGLFMRDALGHNT